MNLLAIDTSSKNFSLAIFNDTRVVRYRNLTLNKVLESSIIPAIEKILRDAHLTLSDLDGFVVGLGPGSFTSLRVGLSTIKALAMATGKPIVGIPSLDILAMNVFDSDTQEICTIVDARRELVYACFYQHENQMLKRSSDYLLVDIKTIIQRTHQSTCFIGDGVKLYRDILKRRFSSRGSQKIIFADEKQAILQVRKSVQMAYDRFQKKEYDDFKTIVPMYLYQQDCQVDQSKKLDGNK